MGLRSTLIAEKGNVSALGLPARNETMPGIFSSGKRPRTARVGRGERRRQQRGRVSRAGSERLYDPHGHATLTRPIRRCTDAGQPAETKRDALADGCHRLPRSEIRSFQSIEFCAAIVSIALASQSVQREQVERWSRTRTLLRRFDADSLHARAQIQRLCSTCCCQISRCYHARRTCCPRACARAERQLRRHPAASRRRGSAADRGAKGAQRFRAVDSDLRANVYPSSRASSPSPSTSPHPTSSLCTSTACATLARTTRRSSRERPRKCVRAGTPCERRNSG